MALGWTQPLKEMSTRNLPGGKGWPAHKADKLTAICEKIVFSSERILHKDYDRNGSAGGKNLWS
jgi:hypothetical protein